MEKTLYKTNERGVAEYGWLHTKYSFSFSNYYNPDKMGFGLLRVLNDDIIEPGSGFGTHPHENMEIISIVLDGALEHKDSMGSTSVIHRDEVQVMSAGTGITHSEYNHSKTESVSLLQLWIFPKEKNIKPRYEQRSFPEANRLDKLKTVVSGNVKKDALYIHQNAEIDLGLFERGKLGTRRCSFPETGFYLFVLEGEINVTAPPHTGTGEILGERDAIGIWDTDEVRIEAITDTKFILIEVPMH